MKPLKHKSYKVLMSDIDGTLIPQKDALPSEKVTSHVAKLKGKIKFGIATSRPLAYSLHIIDHLKIEDPCVLVGGAVIYDPKHKKIIWEKRINSDDVEKIINLSKKHSFTITDDGDGDEKEIKLDIYKKRPPLQFWIANLDTEKAELILNDLHNIETVAAVKVPSWEKDKIDILASHALATKQHGIFEVSKILNIKTKEFIGIGDGYNDFPLLMACGLKVAMGNAVEDLKTIADYVAPSVEEDGVADVIEKFVLNEKQ